MIVNSEDRPQPRSYVHSIHIMQLGVACLESGAQSSPVKSGARRAIRYRKPALRYCSVQRPHHNTTPTTTTSASLSLRGRSHSFWKRAVILLHWKSSCTIHSLPNTPGNSKPDRGLKTASVLLPSGLTSEHHQLPVHVSAQPALSHPYYPCAARFLPWTAYQQCIG